YSEIANLPDADTLEHEDRAVEPGRIYDYRIRSYNGAGEGSASPDIEVKIESGYRIWLHRQGLPPDTPPSGDFDGDGLSNLMKYALDLQIGVPGYQSRFASMAFEENEGSYPCLTYTRPEPSPAGIDYFVEAATDLRGVESWTTNNLIEITNAVHLVTRTISVRDLAPLTNGVPRFMRLRLLLAPP
ncbi:MAG: hypothetical protein U1E27_11440, partial [Kiritimatiellia bacterium]|nr:hypothetical protein [Kiritimatiellia bacterium]